MNDIALSTPVPASKLEENYARVIRREDERERGIIRINRIMAAAVVISLVSNLALACALVISLPLQRVVPLPIIVHDDGTTDTAVSKADMPVSMRHAVIQASVWNYVRYREGYNFADAQHGYDLVTTMSSPQVVEDYQHWFLAKHNHESVQVKIGKRGQINAEKIAISWVNDRLALVRYWRIIQMYGERQEKSSWTATVGIEIIDSGSAAERGGVRVVSYQSAKDSP